MPERSNGARWKRDGAAMPTRVRIPISPPVSVYRMSNSGERMKTYTFEVVVSEGNDEFWEALKDQIGADEVLKALKEALDTYGFTTDEYGNTSVRLIHFDHIQD